MPGKIVPKLPMVRAYVRLDPEDMERIREESARLGVRPAFFLREAVRAYLEGS